MTTASVAEQVADAQIEGRGVNDDLPADNTGPEGTGEPAARARAAETDRETAPPVPASRKRVDPRDEIAKRFRSSRRTSEADEDAAEIQAFAHQGLPPEMVPQPAVVEEEEEELPADRQEDTGEQPAAKRKLNVRGREVELTEDELIAAAQRGLAGDTYLEDARRISDDAKANAVRVEELLREAKGQGKRTPAGEHPASEDAETPERGSSEHPEIDPFVETVRQIAYEDPEKAAASLRDLVRSEVQTASKQSATDAVETERQRDELARNGKTLERFRSDNADIANDPLAVTVVKTKIAEKQHEDLVAMGYDPAVLPRSDDLKEVGRWHLFARSKGFKVRSVETLLAEGVRDYQDWKGGGEKPAATEQPKGKPRVEVRVDRSERRAHIPQQPSRIATPRPDAAAPQPKKRSDVVAAMAQSRGLPRGRIVA